MCTGRASFTRTAPAYNARSFSACRDVATMPSIHLADGRRVPYRVRVSPRSRRVRLTLNPRDGLVMVTPPGVDRRQLAELAHEWRDWVARQLDALGIDDAAGAATASVSLPDCIVLAGIGEQWHVLHRHTPGVSARVLVRDERSLVLGGAAGDLSERVAALRRWLMRRARDTLPPRLEALAGETGLEFGSVTIRAQRNRWGSCSAHGDINLNYQLLFLPPPLLRHVLLHELCHTVELNHSPRFWATVRRFEPDLDARRAEMRRSWTHVPDWLAAAP